MVFVFGLASMPVIGFSAENKQTGNTEFTKKKKPRKKYSKKKKKRRVVKKKRRGSKKRYKGGKKRYSKKKKYSKKKRYSKKKKYSKRKKRSYKRKYYAPPTNSNNVEYRNYKRNSDEGNNSGSEMNIEKIAPQKEIRKEPKKEGEN
jgi:hypothetical protein